MFNFVADRVIKGRIYPSLTRWEARPYTQAWREFGQHWPYTTPLRIQEYCAQHDYPVNVFNINDDLPEFTYYPIGLAFFDFSIDYIDLLPQKVKDRVGQKHLRLLFYYHEGDNPWTIKTRLDTLCQQHGLETNCYVFVSANSSAASLPGFVYFDDFELWYYQRNLDQAALSINQQSRPYDFTVLCREHKWWRATVMADLHRQDLLDNSIWSYCHAADNQDDSDCPIEIDSIPRLRYDRTRFLQQVPKYCDDLSDHERNNHSITIEQFHRDSYGNIVLESQFDVDQSNGAFLTEKTFKPIKHGQFFFVAGGPGSLESLRQLGYRTFDSVLDNSYDNEYDHTERWLKLVSSIKQARNAGVDKIFRACMPDIEHNQQLFLESKSTRLNILLEKIHEAS